MFIATDPLSLLFVGCFLFGLLFLLITTLLGTLGNGSHSQHIGHDGYGHHAEIAPHGPHVVNHTVGNLQGKAVHIHTNTVSQQNTAGKSTIQHTEQGNTASLLAYFNPTSIVLFLLGFGFFGYVFHNITALALPLTLVLAALGGLIVAGLLLALIGRLFGDSEGATVQDVSDRTGMLGKVSVTIQEHGLGEVLYISPGGMRKSIPARSIDGHRLERDQEVVVVHYQHGIAEVDTWEHFINQEHSSEERPPAQEAVNADELAELRALLEESSRPDSQLVMRKDIQKE